MMYINKKSIQILEVFARNEILRITPELDNPSALIFKYLSFTQEDIIESFLELERNNLIIANEKLESKHFTEAESIPIAFNWAKIAADNIIKKFMFIKAIEEHPDIYLINHQKTLLYNELDYNGMHQDLEFLYQKDTQILASKDMEDIEYLHFIFSLHWSEIIFHLKTLPAKYNKYFKAFSRQSYFDIFTLVGKNLSPIDKKIGRNGKCPCGSGKKFKKCCG